MASQPRGERNAGPAGHRVAEDDDLPPTTDRSTVWPVVTGSAAPGQLRLGRLSRYDNGVPRLPSLGPRGEGWLLAQAALFALVILAGVPGGAWSGSLRVATTVLAAGLALAGAGLTVAGVRRLGPNFTPLPHPIDEGTLVQHGIYGHVRHPIYGGLILQASAWACFSASPLAFLATALLLLFFEAKSRREEAWLSSRHAEYAAYRTRTHRFFPGLL